MELGFAWEGFNLRQGYEGSTRVEDPARRESRVLTMNLYARVGLSRRVAFVAQVPYEYRERTAPAIPAIRQPSHDFSNAAIGDLSTILMAQVLPLHGVKPFGLQLGAGVKWDTGPDDRTQDGLRLPVELQTGTGSKDPLVAAVAYHLWGWGSASASVVARFPTRGASGYRYGQEINYALLALRSFGLNWQLGLELRGRSAARDDFRDFIRSNTGGSRLTAGPRALFSMPRLPLVLEGSFLLPVRQNMNDLQLGVSQGATINVRWQVR